MFSFREFLNEENSNNKMTKSRELPYKGNSEVGDYADLLEKFHNHLLNKDNGIEIHHNYEGFPQISFGTHPKNGAYFVGVSGANPNFSHEDIDANHGHDPIVSDKLKTAFNELHKILPRKGNVVLHGAVMHTGNDMTEDGEHIRVTPHETTYSAHKDSSEGRKMANSRIGVIIHSMEKNGKNLPISKKLKEQLKDHPDVNVINQIMKPIVSRYSPEKQKDFLAHLEMATKMYGKMKPEAIERTFGHEKMIQSHINNMKRNGLDADVNSYIDHVTNKFENGYQKATDPSKRDNKSKKYSGLTKQIFDNKDHFDKMIKMNGHLFDAEHVLANIAHLNDPYIHSKNGNVIIPKNLTAVMKNGNMYNIERGLKNNEQQVSEENFASSGAIRGMGYVSGDPGGSLMNYTTLNSSDADTRDQLMNHVKNEYHDKYHKDSPETDKDDSYIKKIASIIKGKR